MSRKSIRDVAKMMNELGLMEISAESSAFFGLIKSKLHLSKRQFCQTNATTNAGIGFKTQLNFNENIEKSAGSWQGGSDGTACAGPIPADKGLWEHEGAVTSPMVGVVYLAPEPSAKPFCEIGKLVSVGDTLALIEAMKTFNPIKATRNGTVETILVKDGDTVEFGTPILVVK